MCFSLVFFAASKKLHHLFCLCLCVPLVKLPLVHQPNSEECGPLQMSSQTASPGGESAGASNFQLGNACFCLLTAQVPGATPPPCVFPLEMVFSLDEHAPSQSRGVPFALRAGWRATSWATALHCCQVVVSCFWLPPLLVSKMHLHD